MKQTANMSIQHTGLVFIAYKRGFGVLITYTNHTNTMQSLNIVCTKETSSHVYENSTHP